MRTFLYVIGREDGPVKIGITNNLPARLRAIQTGCCFKVTILYVTTFESKETAAWHENNFFVVWKEKRLHGEWFDLPDYLAVEAIETAIEFASPHAASWFAAGKASRTKSTDSADGKNPHH